MSLITNPRACYKHELKKAINQIPEREFNRIAWNIIVTVRKVSIEKAKNVSKLWRKEVILILKEFGEID